MTDYAVWRVGKGPYSREYFENMENALAVAQSRSRKEAYRFVVAGWVPEDAEWLTLATYERGKVVVV